MICESQNKGNIIMAMTYRVAVETLINNLKLRGQIDLNRLDLLFFSICDIYRKDRTAGH